MSLHKKSTHKFESYTLNCNYLLLTLKTMVKELVTIDTFQALNAKMILQFNEMQKSKLFRLNISGQEIWDTYLAGFSKEEDPVFRDPSSSTHTCNNDKNFIRRYGNIVAITNDLKIISLFDIDVTNSIYANTFANLRKVISKATVSEVFFETFAELNFLPYEKTNNKQKVYQLGMEKTFKRYSKEEADKFGVVNTSDIYTFHHFHVFLDKEFVSFTGSSVESIMGNYRDAKNVFKRALDEISLDTLSLVKDLISQGSLLDGTTHLHKINTFIPFKKEYDKLSSKEKDLYAWITSYNLPTAKFKNELIGVLCTELAEGKELNAACESWNKRVDPANYMKATAPITKKQIEEAKQFVIDNGYESSFQRRFATIDDIKVSEILHSNVGNASIKEVSIFDNIKTSSTRHKRSEFDKVEEINIEKFMTEILPSCTSVEAFLTSQHKGNLVALTTASENSKQIFKWNNPFSWTFNGNLAGKSQIKETVKSKGGNVTGVLRCSIMWAEQNGDNSDLDLHCIDAGGAEIYFGSKRSHKTNGWLDVDITNPVTQMPNGAVENIAFPNFTGMEDGVYKFFVKQFSARSSKGFKAEIEFDGELYSYSYDKPVSGVIHLAEVTLKNGKLTINHKLPCTDGIGASQTMWNLDTNQFHKVNLVSLTPNHWGDNNIGNKHYLFMLEDCKCEESIRSFHIENLLPELAQHRKVLEVLGNTSMIKPSNKQLSGLGFNSTVKDELVVKVSGSFKRTLKIKF